MRPLDPGPSRRELRRARKGHKTGRRATHLVRTTYGKGQQDRDWRIAFAAMIAAIREEQRD